MKFEPIVAGSGVALDRILKNVEHRITIAHPRRPFRDPGSDGGHNEALFVRSGILALYKPDSLGRRQIIALRFAGECVLPHAGSDYGIQAMTESSVAIVSDFDRAVADNPELAWIFWRITLRNEAIAHEWISNIGRRDSTARIAHLLCELAVRTGAGTEGFNNPFSQQQMAEITGQTSVNVNRVLADLERQGMIKRSGRAFSFPDWAEICRLGSFDSKYLEADLAGL